MTIGDAHPEDGAGRRFWEVLAMKIVIQCAGSKQSEAGCLTEKVKFVAHPEHTHPSDSIRYCRPDEPAETEPETWRDVLARYNAAFVRDGSNPNRLCSAACLYKPRIYEDLVRHFRPEKVFILSARWGLVRGDYLLPDYNITFSKQARKEYRRGKRESGWSDFNQLRVEDGEEVHFFGGLNYLDLFYSLSGATDVIRGKIVIHHKGSLCNTQGGYQYKRFCGNASTNWHYVAAAEFMRRGGCVQASYNMTAHHS
jgi:hypothetical protein